MRDKMLTELPAGIFADMTILESLDLGWNQIKTLPQGVFARLSGLTHVDLFKNKLVAFPDELFDEGTSLQRLSLMGNTITEMPAEVFQQLEAMLASNPQLLELPADWANGHEGSTRTYYYYNTILL